jgi:putative Mn2+ efflux pump MntP
MKIKFNTKERNKIKTNVIVVFLILSFVGLIIITERFEAGARSSDLGQNMRFLEEVFETELYDTFSDFSEMSSEELYIWGENLQKKTYYLGLFIAIIFGMCLTGILNELEEKQK